MRLACVADLHGNLPETPECDVLVIAGDICPATNHSMEFQKQWLATRFRAWLDAQPATHVVATWGNHDWIGQKAPAIVPALRWTLLVDAAATIDGRVFYGTPWQPEFMNWAFNLTDPELLDKFRQIPACDVLVSHGPPFGVVDTATPNGQHLGSQSLAQVVEEIQPGLVVCGHIHGGRGEGRIGDTRIINAAIVDENYRLIYSPSVVKF